MHAPAGDPRAGERHTPWFGKIVAVNGTVGYQVQVGGTTRVRQVPADKVVLHPALLAQRVTVPVVRPPSLFEIGTYVKVNETPRRPV